MSIAKIATIVKKLQRATKKGAIQWEQTEKEDIFEAAFTDFSIRLSTQPAKDPEAGPGDIDYVISIYNSSGTMIESASDFDLQDVMDEAFEILDEIYDAAKGYALGTEQTLDSIISTLDEKE